jgi:hypothetical protein
MRPPAPDESDDTVKIVPGKTVRDTIAPGSVAPATVAPDKIVAARTSAIRTSAIRTAPVEIPAAVIHGRRSLLKPILAGVGLALVPAAFTGAWFGIRPLISGKPVPIGLLTEAQIDASDPCAIIVSAFASDHAVIVIDFPDLGSQGLTLDRVAALVEKAHLPRNRVLTDAELINAVQASGETIESYYYGHDYQAADLAKFFRLAAVQNIRLNGHEKWLRTLVSQLGWLKPGARGAIITVPAAGTAVAPDMRAVILRHEISHGAFYTDATYRAYAETFWYGLTDSDRAAFTGFLGRQGYDTNNSDLMLNETQAYLIFTRDPRFFNAAAVGMTEADIAKLRELFIANMPDFWLRPLANGLLPHGAQRGTYCQGVSAPNPTTFANAISRDATPLSGFCRICAGAKQYQLSCA